jgi:TM2 domain-containing membrane protein YozV
MKCAKHETVEAIAACIHCGKQLCAECAVALDGKTWCRECLAAAARTLYGRGKWWTSRLIAGLLSIIPGAGHMYLGFIGKGFALMGLLFISIFLIILYSDSTGMYWITAYLIPTLSFLLLSYAVFDSMAIAESMKSGKSPVKSADPAMDAIWERVLMNRRTGGAVLLIAGVVGFLNIFAGPLNEFVRTRLSVDFPVTGLVIPVILLVLGILLLLRGKKR